MENNELKCGIDATAVGEATRRAGSIVKVIH